MTNPLTKNEWSMLLRVLEHGEVLHPTDAARLVAKIREAQEPKYSYAAHIAARYCA